MLTLLAAIRNRRRRGTEYESKVASMKPDVRAKLTEDILQATSSGVGPLTTSATTAASASTNNEQHEHDDHDLHHDHDAELQEMETSLNEAVSMLQTAVEREEFVGMRLRRYQTLLRETARELELPPNFPNDNNDTVDVDASNAKDNGNTTTTAAATTATGCGDEEIGLLQLSPEERERRRAKLQQDVAALQRVEKDYEKLKEYTQSLKKRVFKLERQRDVILQKTAECQEFLLAVAVVEGREEAAIEDVEDDVDEKLPVVAPRIDSAAADAKIAHRTAEVSVEDGNKEEQDSDHESDDYVDDSDDGGDGDDDDDLHDYQHAAHSVTKNDDGFGDPVIEKSAE
ncbi:hypothetical protein MHU86_18016 [Fragilaria crotonensis]|nr:hypothetical protein MHU86_18016 [Fragilaria crotonensis]